jgi:hypothetical protein
MDRQQRGHDLIIAAEYSFNGGEKAVKSKYAKLLREVKDIIATVNAQNFKLKESKEKTMPGKLLYAPKLLNDAFSEAFLSQEWKKYRVTCDYPTQYYRKGYKPTALSKGAFREMDFVKEKLGVEIQFGKYSFMVYNVAAKMTIFHKLGVIDTGIEIVPVKKFADAMSTGVSYFEQFIWDLEHRGVSDIDIPVFILGIDR